MTAVHCHACDAPLAVEQRWCVACGARRAGADVRTLLFGPQPPASAVALGAGGTDPEAPRADGKGVTAPAPAPGADAAGRATAAASAGPGSDPALLIARRRRAALPIALASLVGLVAVSATTVPTSLAGSSRPQYTVVLPARAAEPAAEAPPAAEPVEPPAEEPVAPVADAPVVTPPVTATPAAADGPVTDDADDEDEQPARDPEAASPVRHVFVIALGGADLNALAADATAAPYLAGTLADEGTRLSGYRTIARGGLADRIAAISGQGPTPQTRDGCATGGDDRPAEAPADVQPGVDGRPGDAQPGVDDCVHDAKTEHVGDQLRAQKRTWKAYVEPAADAARASTAALAPAALAPAATAPRADEARRGPAAHAAAACDAGPDTTRRNPFLWFRGTLERDDCDERNVPLTQLKTDLKAAKTTPSLAWIASDAQQGPADADRFLERVVPLIQASPAYADGGLIVIVGDLPPAQPETPAPTSPAPPTTTAPSDPAPAAPAPAAGPAPAASGEEAEGSRVGALLISPRTPSGEVDAVRADAFTLLRTVQTVFGLDPLDGSDAAADARPLPKRLFSAAG